MNSSLLATLVFSSCLLIISISGQFHLSDRSGKVLSDRDGKVLSDRSGKVLSDRDGKVLSDRDGKVLSDRDGKVQKDDTCKDTHPLCQTFAFNGYCNKCFYPCEEKKKLCPKTCGLCAADAKCVDCPSTTAKPSDEDY